MRDVKVEGAQPVRLFQVSDLSDVVVIAGPNGVGKTRLLQRLLSQLRGASPTPEITGTLVATSKAEVEAWEGREELDLTSAGDMTLLRTLLQANQRRHYLKSSIVNIESDRSLQKLPAMAPSWENEDPYEEVVSWEVTFNPFRDRMGDTVHSMFRLITSQGQSIANRARELKRAGHAEMRLEFSDPMEQFKRVFSLLLAPKVLVDPVPSRQHLEYRDGEEVRDFATLSSGEREVVNVAFDLLLRNPQDCIVFFDEPELHLHPELSYRLIQALLSIGERNQFFLLTHSPDIISASLERSVVFVAPPTTDDNAQPQNQAVPISESDATNRALRLMGQSIGIVSLGKRLVLIEGDSASIDKQTYGSITHGQYPSLVLVPSGGRHVIESFASVYESVLSKTIWGVDFFMLCDRDSAPPSVPEAATAGAEGRLKVLSRYHLENYFLDENVWAAAFESMEPTGSWLRSPVEIRKSFRALASDLVSYATALAVNSALRLTIGNIDAMPKKCHGITIDELAVLMCDAARRESNRTARTLSDTEVARMVRDYYQQLADAVEADSDDWKKLVPGKPLLGQFAGKAKVTLARAKTPYINANEERGLGAFEEIHSVFAGFEA